MRLHGIIVLPVLAWGFDEGGQGYVVEYHTDGHKMAVSGGGFSMASRVQDGPSNSTLIMLVNGLWKLGSELEDQDFVDMTMQIRKLKNDGRRDEERRVRCHAACKDNSRGEAQDID